MTGFPRLAALAVTLHGGRVVLVKRRNPPDAGLWGFPGGHVEAGETGLAAAARELAEETGIVAHPSGYISNIDLIQKDASGRLDYHYMLLAVICDYVSGAPVASDDALDAGWYGIGVVLGGGLPLSAHVETILRKAMRYDRC